MVHAWAGPSRVSYMLYIQQMTIVQRGCARRDQKMKQELVWRRTTNTSNVVLPSAGQLIPQEAPHELGEFTLAVYHHRMLTCCPQQENSSTSSRTTTQTSPPSPDTDSDSQVPRCRDHSSPPSCRCTVVHVRFSHVRGYIHYFSSYVHQAQTQAGKYTLHIAIARQPVNLKKQD